MKITITGDYSLRAGDVIHCDFPEQSSKKEGGIDKELSGKFMIADICTQLTSKTIFTRIHLVRDSFGRQANSSVGAQGGTSLANANKGNFTNGNRSLPGTGRVNPFDSSSLFSDLNLNQGLFDTINDLNSNQTRDKSGRTKDKTRINANLDDNQSGNSDFNADEYLGL